MIFVTPVALPTGLPRISQADELMLMGSCFASNIAARLLEAKFRCDVNPYGVLYNPVSIATSLREILAGKRYEADELFFYRECWHSPMHHGDFSTADREETLGRINSRLKGASERMERLSALLITFGTAWVYEWGSEFPANMPGEPICHPTFEQVGKAGQVVANCHKLPDSCFRRRRLTVDEIVEEYSRLLRDIWMVNPQLKVVFTVSPIRHVRDGLHANQLSKAVLLLAVERLHEMFPQSVSYFPAYELVLDELRDYRFYADDMLHPSPMAVEYIWEKFKQACLSETALKVAEECGKIQKALAHKPFHPGSLEYKRFLGQIVLKIDELSRKYPYLDLQKERELCHILSRP